MASPRFDNSKYDESNKVKPLDLTKGCRTTFLELAILRNFAQKEKNIEWRHNYEISKEKKTRWNLNHTKFCDNLSFTPYLYVTYIFDY